MCPGHKCNWGVKKNKRAKMALDRSPEHESDAFSGIRDADERFFLF